MFLCKWRARKQISLHRDNKVVLYCIVLYCIVLYCIELTVFKLSRLRSVWDQNIFKHVLHKRYFVCWSFLSHFVHLCFVQHFARPVFCARKFRWPVFLFHISCACGLLHVSCSESFVLQQLVSECFFFLNCLLLLLFYFIFRESKICVATI